MSLIKFGRNYNLYIEKPGQSLPGSLAGSSGLGDTLLVSLPFTIEFDISRKFLSSSNQASIRVYNLSLANRNQIRKNVNDVNDVRQIQLDAGYGTNLATIFRGNITQAWSVREGNNFITQMECFAFPFSNAQTNVTFPSNTPQQAIIETLVKSLPTVSVGAIGSYPGVNSRATSYNGPTCDLLQELTGNGFYIDNNKAYCLNANEVLAGSIDTIDATTGLLGTPVLENSILFFDILFEPRLIVGQSIVLNSISGAFPNQPYKVVEIHHRGTISGAVCGDAITTVGVDYSGQIFKTVSAVA